MKQDQTSSLQELLSSLQKLQWRRWKKPVSRAAAWNGWESREEFFNIVSQSGSDFESRRKR